MASYTNYFNSFDELVANACERMLLDSKAIEKVRLLNETDSTIVGKIKQFIRNLINKIKAEYQGIEPDSQEAKALSKMTDSLDKLYRLFEEAAVDAVKNKQAVGKIKNSGKSTGIEFSQRIDNYPYDMQTVIKDYLASVDQGMLNFIDEHFNNQVLKFGRYSISSVTPKQINDLNMLLNVDVSGYTNAINTNAIQHIRVRHGVEGKADRSMSDNNDIARIEYILNNYDDVDIVKEGEDDAVSREFRDFENNPVPLIQYTKKINGTYYVIQAVPESAYKKLWVVSAFISKNKEVVTQAPNTEKKSPVRMFLTSPTSNNSIPTSDKNVKDDIKNSTRDYSYDALVSKPDMVITAVDNSNVPDNRADLIHQAKKNAAKIGKFNTKDGSVTVRVDDIGRDVILSTDGLRHSLDRRFNVNAPIVLKAGEILSNSIKINELTPEHTNAKESYVLIGVATNSQGDLYIVRSVVNHFQNELMSMDVLYAINAKEESHLDIKKKQSGDYPQGFAGVTPDSLSASTISISNLLDYVNKYFPDVLPEDVLKHYGHTERPDGKIGESALFSTRDKSNREILAEALESTIDTSTQAGQNELTMLSR